MSKSNSSKARQLGTADRQGEGSAGLRSEHGTAQRKTAYYKCSSLQKTDVCKSAFYEKHYGEIVPKLTVEAEVTVSLPWGERTEQGVGIWDTGATQSSIAKHFADRLGIVAQPPTDDELQPMTVMQTTLQGSTLATIRIGDIVLPHMSLKVVDIDPDGSLMNLGYRVPDFIIGMDVIASGRFTVDSTSGETVLAFEPDF